MDGNVDSFLAAFVDWARLQPAIAAVALVGSHARGEARADSDVDLLILGDQRALLADLSWMQHFGPVHQFGLEDYAAVTSLRVYYTGGLEIEYGIGWPTWSDLPLDPGSAGVIRSGLKVLWDPDGRLAAAVASVAN